MLLIEKLQGFPVKEILLNFEKRLFLSFLLIIFVVLLATHIKNQPQNLDSPLPSKNRQVLQEAKNRIKGEADWSPKGYGSGEYLQDLPKIKAGAVLNLDDGNVIWSMNLKQKIAPASLTKLATAMTALDLVPDGETIKVSENAANQIPTKLGLTAGEKLTLKEAIQAAILTSANDATEAIADTLGNKFGENTDDFMELVNNKLQKLGATSSHFETPTGLDAQNHYSTVYDLTIIAHAAKTNYPEIASAAASDYVHLNASANHKVIDLPNWNALLGSYPGVDGLKIGYTENAGHATIVTADREGKKLMAIAVGAQSLEDREMAAAVLLNYGFSKSSIEPYPLYDLNLVKRFEDWHRQLSYNTSN